MKMGKNKKKLSRKASLRRIFSNLLKITYIEKKRVSKKQIKLLHALALLNDVSIVELKNKTKSTNIKSLVRDTNKKLQKTLPKSVIQVISSFREGGVKGYYRVKFLPFLKKIS